MAAATYIFRGGADAMAVRRSEAAAGLQKGAEARSGIGQLSAVGAVAIERPCCALPNRRPQAARSGDAARNERRPHALSHALQPMTLRPIR
jgi:hypothetical protein